MTNQSNSTQDTEDVVAELRSYATWARTRFPGDSASATKAADLIQSLSNRIDVLSARAQQVVDRNVGLVPGYRSTGLADAIDELAAALHQEGI